MSRAISEFKFGFFVYLFWSFVLSLGIGFIAIVFLQSVFAPINAVFMGNEGSEVSTPQSPVTNVLYAAAAICGLLLLFSLATGTWIRKAFRSNKAIKQCRENGTVVLDPDFGFALTRYLYSKVRVDLSRTNFDNYSSVSFPLRAIHRLTEVRVSETSIPDYLIDEILACKSIRKLNISGSTLSNEAAEKLSLMENVEFCLDGCECLDQPEA